MSDYKELIDYLDNFTINGEQIGEFDGGGDSGGFTFDRLINSEMEKLLDDICNNSMNNLEFNWYDGNVSTSGRVYYYSNTKTIVIEGDTEYNDFESLELDRTIDVDFNLPENFHFDSINLYYGNDERTLLRINITSGFITKEMEDWANSVVERIEDILSEVCYLNIYYFDGNILKKDLNTPHSIRLLLGTHFEIHQTINLLDED